MNNTLKLAHLLTPILALTILVGCRSGAPNTDFNKYFQTGDVNTSIHLSRPSFLDEVQEPPKVIYLELTNDSDELIKFPVDFGIRLFVYHEQLHKWEEIGNDAVYSTDINNQDEDSANKPSSQEAELLLYPEDSPFNKPSTREVSVFPMVNIRQLPVNLRVLVTGTIYRENKVTDEKVAAYYDLLINNDKTIKDFKQ